MRYYRYVNDLCYASLLLSFLLFSLVSTIAEGLTIHIDHVPLDKDKPALRIISFCLDCEHPDDEGSYVYALAPKHGLSEYRVKGELIYGVPNHGEVKELLNHSEFDGRIVLIHRGKVHLQEKVMNVQYSGAAGVIIVDDGQCNEDFSRCGPRAGSVKDGGFAPMDEASAWKRIHIPVLMVTKTSAAILTQYLQISEVDIPKFGKQFVTPDNSLPSGWTKNTKRGIHFDDDSEL